MFIKTVAAVALALGMTGTALADDTYAYLGAVSDHPFSDEEYNENHKLAAIEYDSYMAGYFRNSYDEDALLLGYHKKFDLSENIEAGIILGGMYGYRDCFGGWSDSDRKLCPAVAATLAYTKYDIQPIAYILGQALAVGARYEF